MFVSAHNNDYTNRHHKSEYPVVVIVGHLVAFPGQIVVAGRRRTQGTPAIGRSVESGHQCGRSGVGCGGVGECRTSDRITILLSCCCCCFTGCCHFATITTKVTRRTLFSSSYYHHIVTRSPASGTTITTTGYSLLWCLLV